jgi:hypothetical protein
LSKTICTLELGSRVEVDMASSQWRDMYGGAVQLQVSDGSGPAITVTLDGGDARELLAALTAALEASEADYQAAHAAALSRKRSA